MRNPSNYEISVSDGKYTFRNLGCGFEILRNDEEWMTHSDCLNIKGSNAFYALLHKVEELEKELQSKTEECEQHLRDIQWRNSF